MPKCARLRGGWCEGWMMVTLCGCSGKRRLGRFLALQVYVMTANFITDSSSTTPPKVITSWLSIMLREIQPQLLSCV